MNENQSDFKLKCNIVQIKEVSKSKGELVSFLLVEVISSKPLRFYISRKPNQFIELQHMIEVEYPEKTVIIPQTKRQNIKKTKINEEFKQLCQKLLDDCCSDSKILKTTFFVEFIDPKTSPTLGSIKNPTKMGFLEKKKINQGLKKVKVSGFKTRWCILYYNRLYYFSNKEENDEPLGQIKLEYCHINLIDEGEERKFEIVLWGSSKVSYIFKAPSLDVTKEWIRVMRAAKVKFMNMRFSYQIPPTSQKLVGQLIRQPSTLGSDIKPEDYNPSFSEAYYQDDLLNQNIVIEMNDTKSRLIGGTVEKIVEKLLDEVIVDNSTILAFLLTMHSMLEPVNLFDQLVSYYYKPPKSLLSKGESEPNKGNLNKAQLRIIVVLTKWMEVHLRDFIRDKTMLQNLISFASKIENTQVANKLNNTIKKVCTLASKKKHSVLSLAPPSILPTLYPDTEFDFFDFSVTEIARQFCLTEFEIYKNIHPKEFHNQGWNRSSKLTDSPNISKLIDRFNQTSRFITTTIVRTRDLSCRAAILAKWIQIGELCRQSNNFNTIMEIVSSLSSSPITRLKKTWKILEESVDPETGNKDYQTYLRLSQIVSHEKSFSKLRESLRLVEPPCIPYVGLYLTDITFIDVGNKDFLSNTKSNIELHNFEKRIICATVIKEVNIFQEIGYNFTPVPILCNMIIYSKPLDEEEAYKTSLMIEPKLEKK
eukprot:TRINITY_DN2515_c1_g1_i1.p1 TRINITY_DN2515_c1_g1~~TRINITY_DN2515_c1_g1_i1.p1  ORF type:complete len:704 (+),score=208.08 TRINITY_DN2515_c1_g1_i1:52-2163(+)